MPRAHLLRAYLPGPGLGGPEGPGRAAPAAGSCPPPAGAEGGFPAPGPAPGPGPPGGGGPSPAPPSRLASLPMAAASRGSGTRWARRRLPGCRSHARRRCRRRRHLPARLAPPPAAAHAPARPPVRGPTSARALASLCGRAPTSPRLCSPEAAAGAAPASRAAGPRRAGGVGRRAKGPAARAGVAGGGSSAQARCPSWGFVGPGLRGAPGVARKGVQEQKGKCTGGFRGAGPWGTGPRGRWGPGL